jgi:TolA-binding protein
VDRSPAAGSTGIWKRRLSLLVALCCLLACGAALADEESSAASQDDDDQAVREQLAEQIEELRKMILELEALRSAELEELREQYERQLEELRRQIEILEQKLRAQQQAPEDDELRALRAEAEEAAADQKKKEKEAEAERESGGGRQRNLQATNPEISFLGDISYDWTDNDVQNQFVLRAAEINFQAALDPYTRFKGFLAAHQELPQLVEGDGDDEEDGEIGVDLEETYIEWLALPLRTRLRVGRFRQQFGTLNRWHQHALASTDVPFALRNTFGDEGLIGLGVSADWQLPRWWASSNSLVLEITNADNESAFAGGSFSDPAVLLRHTGFFDLGPDTYFELGLTGMVGPNTDDGSTDTKLGSLDVNFAWEPVQRARYRGIELRGEYIRSRFEVETAPTIDARSLYLYLMWKLAQRWIVGLRYDDAELPSDRFDLIGGQPFEEGLRERALTPFLTFWQSEWVRLRFQYQHASRDFAAPQGSDDDNRAWIQVTFAAGPHKHDEY